MFQPMGPNLRRSWQTAWKKQNPYTSLAYASGFAQSDNIRSSHFIIEPRTFARRPFGGSFVIFTPFCSSSAGNCFVGIEVSHRRYIVSVSSGFICSQMRSSSGNQLMDKWQLQSKTQAPSCLALSIMRAAFGPWPWPSEMLSNFDAMPLDSANCNMSLTGSLPAERMKISGDIFVESSKETEMSKTGGSTNFCPISCVTKATTEVVKRSGLNVRRKHILCKGVTFASQSPGNFSRSASGTS
mmetsp:Transcript_66757/g.204253  ORF Transcript_66757/g.204253 Transcript_66757/m.204253 type:complete len:241 (-) Transcript_66757:5715-6437(-)